MTEVLDAPLCLPPRPLRNDADVKLPQGTCDCHFHAFAREAPLASPRSYTPQPAAIEGWLALADMFGIARGVIVQPSVYGTDNTILLAALNRYADRLRGVVVVPGESSTGELMRLHHLGVRGVRINLRNKAGIGLDAVPLLAPRIREWGWHLQFQVGPEHLETVAWLAAEHDIRAVIDHLGFVPLDGEMRELDRLRRTLDDPRVSTKISAPYRLRDKPGQDGYRQAVALLADSHPDKLLWGSDWPHTELFGTMPEEDDLMSLALDALPASVHQIVFIDSPNTLYWSS